MTGTNEIRGLGGCRSNGYFLTDTRRPGGATMPCMTDSVRHDPQRFMGKIAAVLHFNCDTVEFASPRGINQTQGSKHRFLFCPFLKNITEESDLEDFQDLIMLAIGFIRQFQ